MLMLLLLLSLLLLLVLLLLQLLPVVETMKQKRSLDEKVIGTSCRKNKARNLSEGGNVCDGVLQKWHVVAVKLTCV